MPVTNAPDVDTKAKDTDATDDSNTPDVKVAKKSTVSAKTVKQDKPEPKVEENAEPQSYVHLADGTVLRVNDEDLPGHAGSNAHLGHWQTGDKVYQVIGVYPVEDIVAKDAK